MAKKKTVTLFEAKSLETPVADSPVTTYEDYSLIVEPPKGFPAPIETIKTSKNVPGGFLWTAHAFEGNPSFLDPKVDKVTLCLSILAELDKGNKGFFSNAYFMNCNILTPELKQFDYFKEQFLNLWKPAEKPTEDMLMSQFGAQMRIYLRGIIFRLFSYYYMGYKVKFEKYVPVKTEVKEASAAAN